MERHVCLWFACIALLAWPSIGAAQSAPRAGAIPPAVRTVGTEPATSATRSDASASHVRIARVDRKALEEIQEEGRLRVSQLTAQMQNTPPGATRLALQRQVEQVKLDYRCRVLRALAAWARAHGNAPLAEQSEKTARQLEILAQPATVGSDMPFAKTLPPKQEVRP